MAEIDQRAILRDIAMALVDVSEANGCSLDAHLALLNTLGPSGLLGKKEDGKFPYVEALKAQHSAIHDLNERIIALLQSLEIDGVAGRLNPQPSSPSDERS
jgi:hypothetical protein